MKEKIHQPSHYMSNGEETIVKIVRELGIEAAIDFCKGNVIKYRDRAEYKGQMADDLEKIKEYTWMASDLATIEVSEARKWREKKYSVYEYQNSLMESVKKWSENGHNL